MAHDVFISYSSKDSEAGEAVRAALERHGIDCWMAPRDIVPGVGWAKSIVQAIGNSRAMVLVLSANANASPQIEREVERAVNKGVPIVPVRIENVAPSEALEYFLSAPHWLDAFMPPLEAHLERLAPAVRVLLGPGQAPAEGAPHPPQEAPAQIAALREECGTPVIPVAFQPSWIFSGVDGAERNSIVVAALASIAAVVAILGAGAIAVAGVVGF
jgi:hypothetical protein